VLIKLVVALLLFAPIVTAQTKPLAIINGQVIDMRSERPHRATIIVRAGRVEQVAPRARIPSDADTLDASGAWIIPGLWDMHTHIWSRTLLFPMYVANGITGVRDMGWSLPLWRAWRDSVSRGLVDGPHAIVSGVIVDGLPPFNSMYVQVKTPDEGRAFVRDVKARGADFIKVYDRLSVDAYNSIMAAAKAARIPVAGHVPPGVSAMEASRAGQRSIEHLTSLAASCSAEGTALGRAAAAGLDSVRDLDFSKDSTLRGRVGAALGPYYHQARQLPLEACDVTRGMPAVARALRAGGTWVTPTVILGLSALIEDTRAEDSLRARLPSWAAGMSRVSAPNADSAARKRSEEKMLAMMRELKKGGVRMLIGSDAPNPGSVPGIGLHRELELFVKAGYTPYEVLRIATHDAAEFAGVLDSIGTIEPGKLADLVVLDANPLVDIRNARRIRAVLLQGRVLPADTLRARLYP
jgi:imidazolonepropionase-like amidohydrolase